MNSVHKILIRPLLAIRGKGNFVHALSGLPNPILLVDLPIVRIHSRHDLARKAQLDAYRPATPIRPRIQSLDVLVGWGLYVSLT